MTSKALLGSILTILIFITSLTSKISNASRPNDPIENDIDSTIQYLKNSVAERFRLKDAQEADARKSILNGLQLLNQIRNGELSSVKTVKEYGGGTKYQNDIRDLQWAFYHLTLKKESKYENGAILIEDRNHRLGDFFTLDDPEHLSGRYDRTNKSSHLKHLGFSVNQFGMDVEDSETHASLPAGKRTILFARIPFDSNKNPLNVSSDYLFIKNEEHSVKSIFSKEAVKHVVNLVPEYLSPQAKKQMKGLTIPTRSEKDYYIGLNGKSVGFKEFYQTFKEEYANLIDNLKNTKKLEELNLHPKLQEEVHSLFPEGSSSAIRALQEEIAQHEITTLGIQPDPHTLDQYWDNMTKMITSFQKLQEFPLYQALSQESERSHMNGSGRGTLAKIEKHLDQLIHSINGQLVNPSNRLDLNHQPYRLKLGDEVDFSDKDLALLLESKPKAPQHFSDFCWYQVMALPRRLRELRSQMKQITPWLDQGLDKTDRTFEIESR